MDERFLVGGPMPNSVGALADLYSEVRELRLAMQKAVDQVHDREIELRKVILTTLLESPDNGAVGNKYRVQLVKKKYMTAKDWPALYAWIRQNGMFELLQKRLSDRAVKDLYEQYGQLPPGVEETEVDDLSFSKVD